MITNSSINKLKASKSSRDLEDVREGEGDIKSSLFERREGEKDKLTNIPGDSTNIRTPLPTIVICQRERPDNRLKSRTRVRDDFRMARGGPMDRRGSGIRSRGGCISRKVEREGESNLLSRGKFQESLNKGNSDSAISSKYYSDTERSKSRLEFGYMVPEDSRISKLLRRLCREDDSEKFLHLCKQLQESLMMPENGRYIRRSLDLIAESLLDMLHSGPGSDAKSQAAKCLGRVGYVLEQDFKRYMDWVFSKYAGERNDEVRLLLMKAMAETLRLEGEMPKLKDFSVVLMTQLQTALENTDLPELLMGTVDVIILLTEIYPSTFTKHFRDTVDILVGWHIDGSQAITVTQYASCSLQKLTRYWVADLQFSLTLLGQFLEDMEAYGEDLVFRTSGRSSPAEDPPPTPEDCILRITSLIRVFNTVTKSLGQHLNPAVSPTVTWTFITDCFAKMLRTVVKALDICVDEDLIVTANECTCLLLLHLQSKTSAANEMLYGLIDTQLSLVPQLADFTIISMLKMIAKTIREVSANLPLELVQKLLGSDSPLMELRFSPSLNIQEEVLAVYHSLLNLKNIPLLQEAYRYVLGDLEIAYKMYVPSVEELCQQNPHTNLLYKMDNAETVILFHLHALADLANASNSIIGMWALKPSIFELLAVKLLPYDKGLAQHSPVLQYSVLYLLFSHCSRYNHFVSSSGLVSSTHGRSNVHDILGLPVTLGPEVPTTSPTSGHLSIILGLLANMLSQETSEETRLLVLSWTRELLVQAQPYLTVLHQTPEFEQVLFAIIGAGFHHSAAIVLGVSGNVEQLLAAKEVPWKDKLLSKILDLCVLHMNSTNSRVRGKFSRLLSLVPWYITVQRLTDANHAVEVKNKPLQELSGFTLDILNAAQRHHLSRGTCGDMQPQHFRKFMGYLLQGVQYSDNDWLQDMFCSCWPLQPSPRTPDEDKAIFLFGNLALASNLVLLLWAAWEAAQLCVMYKLRTPLGKPQDTFTNIEGAIKCLAREINQPQGASEDSACLPHFKESTTPTNGKHAGTLFCGTWEQWRIRLLLEFLEHLEKAMHNAAEGCATAMLPPPKPVRTFFHTNKSTCGEWLTRIRSAVVVVAIHAGQATTAVRHGHCMLQDMADTNNTQGPEFERAVMYVCWALCKLREPEAIQGLYAWCKDVAGRKFTWLKAASEQAHGRFETAADDYRKLLNQECVGSTPHNSPTHLVTDENTSSSPVKQVGKTEAEQHILGFMADQLTECYKAVNNWTDLLKWKEKEAEMWMNQNGGTPRKYLMSSVTSTTHAKALARFEEGELTAVNELMKWNVQKPSPTEETCNIGSNNRKCWSSYKLMGKTYTMLTSIAMTLIADGGSSDVETDNIVWGEKIDNCSHIAQYHLQEGLRNAPSEFLQEAAVLQYAASGLQSMLAGKLDCTVFNVIDGCDIGTLSSSVLTQVLWWAKYFNQAGGNILGDDMHCRSSWVNKLMLQVSKVSRKEGNLMLAQKLLIDYLKVEDGLLCGGTKNKLLLEEVAQSFINTAVKGKEPDMSISTGWSIEKAKALTEVAKVLYSLEKHDSAVQVCAVTALKLAQQVSDQDLHLCETGSRLLLTLAKWLQQENHLVSAEADNDRCALGQLLAWEKAHSSVNDTSVFGTVDVQSCSTITHNGVNVIPPMDAVIGRLLQLGVSRCPELAKAWSQFAAWCYRWGRRVVDAASEAGGQLSEVDRVRVQELMPPGMTADDLDRVYFILSQTRAVADEEDIETDDINTSEMIENQLQDVHALSGASNEQLSHLVEIWRDAQKRIYSYYELSAVAYFKYLELCGDKESVVGGMENNCTTITATLRLLRLIVKHALELQTVLESGLATTPTRPWKGIIPQLFSRLSHPEPYVRRRVSELLCRVAEDAPHLITFPAVVGAAAGGARLQDMTMGTSTSRLFSACLSQPSAEEDLGDGEEEEEEEEDEEECASEEENQVSVLKNCFLAMVDTLSKQAPEAISQVQLLVQELRRITLLWDELWLGTLVQHHAEISRRLQQLELEVLRVEDNASLSLADKDRLITEKHRIILKPLVFILEQLHAITSVPPETPHEKWFQEKFGEYITDALHKLKTSWNPRRPQESWQPLKQLQSRLQQRAQKRTAYTIHMVDISPALASLKDSVIAMPGVASRSGTIITVSAVDNNIAILPTKTKPKKLVFHGSDGQLYTYLFKGLEDLHLDERIMQFLSIANTMMQRSSSTSDSMYRARHYSVIPLGPRSGLISWVDGVTPLFGLYKRWQQRETATLSLRGGQSSMCLQAGNGPGQVMRPSELFYSKLTPLLKERGISNLDNRKEWPLPVLRQVLTELMDETPKDLLAKELWCHSVNAGSWWQTTRTYSYSVAVMSIIGYIIGLGDRHLDNVLVDLLTGEVVHIDYNVCFEKGKTLRVPEKVPFRMTPNIRTALGVTGVEGIFRLACEHVLKVMKKGRETLLTLLEAFVYDPLIDWTPGSEAGYTGAVYGGGQAVAMETKHTRKELEREVTLGMFCVRVAEMKADWLANRDELLAAILELVSRLNQWLEAQGRIKVAKESLQDCHQQMALVKEAEAHGPSAQHPLYTLAGRYAKHCRARDAKEKARAALREKIEDCEKHLNLHKAALASVKGPQLAQWVAELNFPMDKDSHMVFDLVKEFLQNAGQGQMILQCEQSESELGQLAQQQILLVRSCLDLLSQYGTVASLYPASYLNSHRSVCYRCWAQQLLNNMSVESCHEVRAQFHALFSPETINNKPLSQQVLAVSYQLQTSLAEANARLKKSYERLAAEGLPESGVQFEAAYNEARVGISAFLRGEKGAAMALECVNITALCALNKRYLMMEAAALSAGDCLVDLTSRDGDWFLDEMYLVSTLVIELASLLPSHHQLDSNTGADTRVELVLQCLKSAHNIYKGLQELNFNFHTIILPEALKTIQTEEPTVLAMVNELDDIIAGVGCPLEDLLAQLEMHLRYIIMEMDSPHHSAQNMVAQIRTRFELLLLRPAEVVVDGLDDQTTGANVSSAAVSTDDVLTPGQMLLMGFNGLFEKLQLEGNALIAALDTLDTPHCWKKVDQVWEAKAMAAPVFNDATRAVLEDIFLLKRLSTMQEFFLLCGQVAHGVTSVHDDDHLNKPIRRFTADYVSRQLLGVTSQTLALALCLLLHRIGLNVTVEVEQRDIGAENKVSLEELCRKAVDLCMKSNHFSGGTLAQASGLTSTLEATWRRREVARHLQQQVEAQRSTLQRLQLQLTAHHWLHEDTLMMQGAALAAMAPISRPTFMLELRKTSSALLALQPRLSEAREQQSALVASVEQRLKWAAGANPALSEVMAAFESAISSRSERLNLEQRLSTLVGNTCSAVLHHEALRTRTSEGLAHDTAFLQLVDQCEKSCMLAAGCEQAVTPAEESLIQLLTPDGPIDHTWIHNAEMLISDTVKTLQQQMVGFQESLFIAQDCLKNQVLAVRNRLSSHHKLMSDVRNLLKSMVKLEDCGLKGLQEYVMSYRAYSEQFSALIRELMSDELDVDRVHKAMDQLEHLKEKTSPIYEELVMFAKQQEENQQEGALACSRPVAGEEAVSSGSQGGRSKRPPLLRQESICLSPRKGVPVPTAPVAPSVIVTKPSRDPHTGKAVQERNAYALGVWRRVRMKLEGRDPDPGRRATVQEQVEYVIREAMSLDNLALLYEGWTPWV